MDAKKKEAIKNCESFDELLDAEYGERGTEDRETFEAEAGILLGRMSEGASAPGRFDPRATGCKDWHEEKLYLKDREWACGCTTLYALPYLCRTG